MTSFYTQEELEQLGLKSIGKGVLLSRKVSIYGGGSISIGDYTRIDDFCILSGNISIAAHVHISAFCALFGGVSGIVLRDFTGISSRSAVYADTDDYSGFAMTNPTIPDEYRNIIGGTVILEKHALVGTGCTILPNVVIGEGTSVGGMSLINKSLEPWGVYVGIPCRRVKERSKRILTLEQEFLNSQFK